MGVTIGEVQAVLSARDIMSPVMVQAAERVRNLETMLKNLGATSGGAFDALNERLQLAQANFDSLAKLNAGALQQAMARTQASIQQTAANAATLGTNVAGVNTGLAQTATAATATANAMTPMSGAVTGGANAMTQMEGIAARLITRMAILYALRGSFEFVIGIYESAKALVEQADALEVSIHGFQIFQEMAEKTGIPVNKLATAFDNLGKKLADQKIGTEDALESIGLSFSKLATLKPEERINAVALAISALPDKLKRTEAEMKLFGTDGIDPMIKAWAALQASAEASNQAITDDTARQLTATVHQFQDAWDQVKKIAAEGYNSAINSAANLFSGKGLAGNKKGTSVGYPSGGEGLPGGAIDDNPSTGEGNDINLPKDSSTIQGSGIILQDYIDKLQMAAAGEKELTEEQVRQMTILKDLNLLTADNAAKLDLDGVSLDINTEKFKKFTKAMTDLAKDGAAAERYAKQWEAAEKEVADLWTADAQSYAALQKVKAATDDAWFKYREGQELAENKDRLTRGTITDQQFFNNKAAIERKYFDEHTEMLRANETYSLDTLDNQEQKAMERLEEQHNQGKLSEEQYQEGRLAIAEEYANKRLAVEDQFNSDMDIRRRNELDKEAQDKKDAAASQQKAAEAAAAFKQRVMDAGNTSKLPELSEEDLKKIYGNLDNAKERLKEIQDYYNMFPGAQNGVAGLTGLGSPGGIAGNTKEGWDKLLDMQREYQQLLNALGKLHDKVSTDIGDNAKAIAKSIAEAAKAALDAEKKLAAEAKQAQEDALFAANLKWETMLSDPNSKLSFARRAEDAKRAYEFMMKYSDMYTQLDIDNAKSRMEEAKKQLDDWQAYAEAALKGVTGEALTTALALADLNRAWADLSADQLPTYDNTKYSNQTKFGGQPMTGFGEGGTVDVMVGENGPEVLRAPLGSQIAPTGSGFADSVKVQVFVSGMMDPATIRQISDAIMKEIMKTSKKSTLHGSR